MVTPLVIHPLCPSLRRADVAPCAAALCLAVFLFCASPLIKLICLGAALMCAGSWAAGRTSSLAVVAGAAAALFGLAFLAAPYASITSSCPAVLSWAMITGCGAAWVACVTTNVRWAPTQLGVALPALAVVGVLTGPSLFAALSWRGDEDYLIERVLNLVTAMQASPSLWIGLLGATALGGVLCVSGQRVRVSVRVFAILGAAMAIGIALATENVDGRLDYDLRRYPYLSVWGHVLTSWFGGSWSQALSTDPALHRVWPALGLVLLVLGVTTALRGCKVPWFWRATVVAAVCTTPVLLFYSTLVYIDLWLIALMTIVAFNVDDLIEDWLSGRAVNAAWLALMCAMFVKETVIVFAAVVLLYAGVRALSRIAQHEPWRPVLCQWARLGAVLIIPLALYLFFRAQGSVVHYGYHFALGNFNQLRLYEVMAQSYAMLFGPVLLPALWGAVVLLRERPRLVLFCAGLFLAYWLFFFGLHPRMRLPDGDSLPKYAGYGRFMMYMLPPVVVCAVHGLVNVCRRHLGVGAAVVCTITMANVLLAPVRLDGSRPAGWGSFVHDTEAHQYPYDEVYAWLAARSGRAHVTVSVVGRRYTYAPGDRMYSQRHGLSMALCEHLIEREKIVIGQPAATLTELEADFMMAAANRPDVIVVHQPVWGASWPDPPRCAGYRLAQRFDRHTYHIVTYTRDTEWVLSTHSVSANGR